MRDIPEVIWSNTDFPYSCLVDRKRTLAFRSAISETVKPGDVVVEVGAGTGILSLFAIEAGASLVYAVELDPILAATLKETAKLNNYEDKFRVIEGDAMTVELPQNVDVVLGELIETGLIDEMQVMVMNSLHERGVIGAKTSVIPQSYETSVQLVSTNNKFYGYKIAAPKHNWPLYSEDPDTWEKLQVEPVSNTIIVGHYDFTRGFIDPMVDQEFTFEVEQEKQANALLISGVGVLSQNVKLGASNTFSGDKILSLPPGNYIGSVKLHIQYAMSTGLANLIINQTT